MNIYNKCPKCNSDMYVREGTRGKFLGCSKYPDCHGTLDYLEAEQKCEFCGEKMVLKEFKEGKFYICPKQPQCKGILNYEEKCPRCGSAMLERRGPKGSFLGCSNFPTCKGSKNIIVTKEGFESLINAVTPESIFMVKSTDLMRGQISSSDDHANYDPGPLDDEWEGVPDLVDEFNRVYNEGDSLSGAYDEENAEFEEQDKFGNGGEKNEQ